MSYNVTAYVNQTNIFKLFTVSNDISNGALAAFTLLSLFIILFITFKNYDSKSFLVMNCLLCSIIAGFMYSAGLISMTIFMICTFFFVLTFGFYALTGKET